MLSFFFEDNKFIKPRQRVRLVEVMILDFIARNTTIPIPFVLDIFSVDGVVHMVQEFINVPVLAVV
jgi:hypothetical protein